MIEDVPWPIFGLPVAEWQAALRAVESVVPQIDDRLLEARLSKDGTILIRTGELRGGLNGRGDQLLLRKGTRGWEVAQIVEWRS